MFRRYLSFLKVARDEFSDILIDVELHADRVRLILIDSSWIDVRYPVEDKFSFHWQRDDKIYRIDTAPHHKGIKSFPRHIHLGSEDNVIEDHVLEENVSPEENFRRFMEWVRGLLRGGLNKSFFLNVSRVKLNMNKEIEAIIENLRGVSERIEGANVLVTGGAGL